MVNLIEQVTEQSKKVRTDVVFMSIGEVINLYKDGELIINPIFQRLFRWDKEQKTNFIESILLGIPTPSIFVSETYKRKWELIDGLQRVSTILEFAGELKKENEPLLKYNKITKGLLKAEYLYLLEGKTWNSLEEELKIKFKRTRININIILNDSDPTTKYEIFNRLNTGGSFLSNQEIRNSLLLQFNESFYIFLMKLKTNEKFQNVVNISDKDIEKEQDTELILRFFSIKNYNSVQDGKIKSVSSFISQKMKQFIQKDGFNFDKEEENFNTTFSLLNEILGEKTLKRYYKDKAFYGRTILPGFDTITSGIGYNIENGNIDINTDKEKIMQLIQDIWGEENFNINIGVGKSTESKLIFCEEYGKEYFNIKNR